jgi:hypothetical protein
MRTKSVLSMLILTAAVLTFAFHDAEAGFPAPPGVPGILIPPGLPGSSVNVRVDGYVPAPPGVNVQIDSGRPYYVESNRRVYIERERPGKHYDKKYYKEEKKHYKKHKKHHEDRGNHYGHDK